MSIYAEAAAGSFYAYEGGGDFGDLCVGVCERAGYKRAYDPAWSAFAIAPLLSRKLAKAEWPLPNHGTLIFHPSALPYRRGPDAVRNTVASGERVSAATWFWCDGGLDTGDVCEAETVVLMPGESAGRAYHSRFVPAGVRALERAVAGIASGSIRRVRQDRQLATYDKALKPAG